LIEHTFISIVVSPSANDKVAFSVYLSSDEDASGRQHIVDFDIVQTNIGNGFHARSGMFNAPSSDVYVLNWVILSKWYCIIYTQLMRNSDVLGEIVSDSTHNYEFHSATGLIVTELNQGDEVYVRLHPTLNMKGQIISRPGYRSSFSGWKI
jgi:hypothetical protein